VVENQKNDKVDQKWIQIEAINKGLSRALKLNKLEFVKLFLDYGADVEQVICPYFGPPLVPCMDACFILSAGKRCRSLRILEKDAPDLSSLSVYSRPRSTI
jgi:hypothetical protein